MGLIPRVEGVDGDDDAGGVEPGISIRVEAERLWRMNWRCWKTNEEMVQPANAHASGEGSVLCPRLQIQTG